MTAGSNLDYFETDQVRYAVMLWRLVRKAGGTDFDVLAFGRDWQYAEAVILQCLASENEAVADAALDLMQLRMRFERLEPLRASILGAPGAPPARPAEVGKPDDDTPPANGKYLKSLR